MEKPNARMGTSHLYFNSQTAGYVNESIAKETRTRNSFYDGKLRITRVPNTVFGELPSDIKPGEKKGDYLVSVPDNHLCYTWKDQHGTLNLNKSDDGGIGGLTLKERQRMDVQAILEESREHKGAAYSLQRRITTDQLKLNRTNVSKQLRETELSISKNAAEREKAMFAHRTHEPHHTRMNKSSRLPGEINNSTYAPESTHIVPGGEYFEQNPEEPDLPNRGLPRSSERFPSQRSKPVFTLRLSGNTTW